MLHLDKLQINSHATIVAFTEESTEQQRLVSLGFTIGSEVKILRKIHSGHMIHCRIKNTEFAIRKSTASKILCKK